MKNISYLEAKKINDVIKHNIHYNRCSVLNQVCFDSVYNLLNGPYVLTTEQYACLINLLNQLKCNHRIIFKPISGRISVFATGFWNMNGTWYNDDIWSDGI